MTELGGTQALGQVVSTRHEKHLRCPEVETSVLGEQDSRFRRTVPRNYRLTISVNNDSNRLLYGKPSPPVRKYSRLVLVPGCGLASPVG